MVEFVGDSLSFSNLLLVNCSFKMGYCGVSFKVIFGRFLISCSLTGHIKCVMVEFVGDSLSFSDLSLINGSH